MPQKKIIAITGATGAQGGGLARAILNDANGEFTVRALTRDASSDKAKELSKLGAEVMAGDIDDPESLKRFLKDVYGAFFVTFFGHTILPKKKLPKLRSWPRRRNRQD